MPQRVSDHACFGMGTSGLGLLLDRLELFGREGDRAGVLLVELEAVSELGEKVSDDFALGLSEEGVAR